jgi:hypothetical protein
MDLLQFFLWVLVTFDNDEWLPLHFMVNQYFNPTSTTPGRLEGLRFGFFYLFFISAKPTAV